MKISNKLVSFMSVFLLLGLFNFSNATATGGAFDKVTHISSETGSKYNKFGYDIYGYDVHGYTPWKFDRNGIHKITGTRFSNLGYDVDGYSEIGAYQSDLGFFVTDEGFADFMNGYNSKGFNFHRKHRLTGTEYDPDGYNAEGFNKEGVHRDTGTEWSPGGFNVRGINHERAFVSKYHIMRR